ncbi:FliI/YscN family ATPase [Thalassococcus sp. S3]|uniref:FliI/YscN family ATPase n=1 Tax=Thalassococcus sp. S3 TaxID=2017482 RepID=UPI00102473B4|nr:FliI/YscN family ATPase [Thalassococcus sp. S3]QBF33408.1 flagellum-specific ATP synthase FliI [Thalassococcus sp. S3]
MTGAQFLSEISERLERHQPRRPLGQVTAVRGTVVHAHVPHGRIGAICELLDDAGEMLIEGQIVGFSGDTAILSPLGSLTGIGPQTMVRPCGEGLTLRAGPDLLGRVVDARLTPIDGAGPISGSGRDVSAHAAAPDPMSRPVIDKPFPVGVRSIDAVATTAIGQRVGIFGEAGGGKSTLMASIVKGCTAQTCVIGMIGERGREVREFFEHQLDDTARRRGVIVASTSDRPAGERMLAAYAATSVAEYFRDQGQNVLLLIDSLTRFARAQREVGLAAGEAPVRRGFPVSTFSGLPDLLERAGPAAKGTITAFYTVLVEGDGEDDPVAEEVRGILDGHLVLSAELARENHYPAIDLLRSRSRLMDAVVSREHVTEAADLRRMLAAYRDVEFLVRCGEYEAGSDPVADRAIALYPAIRAFLVQDANMPQAFSDTRDQLAQIMSQLAEGNSNNVDV